MAQNHFKPQPFTGKEDVDAWLNSFTRYADFANWDDHRKYFALKTMFKEGAAQWLQRLDHEGVVNDYDLLVAAMREKYQLQPSQIFQLRQQLLGKTQGPLDVSTYAEEVEHLCHRLNIDEVGQLHYFIKGLQPKIRKQVHRGEPENIDRAIAIAKAEEAAQKLATSDDKETKVNLEMLADLVVSKLKVNSAQVANVQTDSQPQAPSQSPMCQLCHQQGHTAPQCPMFANQTFMHGQPVPPQFGPPPSQYGPPPPHYGPPSFQPQQTQYGPPRQRRKPRDRNTVQCWTCKQWGHYQYECLKNQGNSGGPAHNQ